MAVRTFVSLIGFVSSLTVATKQQKGFQRGEQINQTSKVYLFGRTLEFQARNNVTYIVSKEEDGKRF